jgi:hypothetical protein
VTSLQQSAVSLLAVTSAALSTQRFSISQTNSNAGIAFEVGVLRVQTPATGPNSVTIRLGGVQLELGSVVHPWVPTNGVAAISGASATVTVALADSANSDVTNWVRNSTNVGVAIGTPGVLPTNWSFTAGVAAAGLATQVVGFGIETGIPYVDIRFFGTTSALGNTGIYFDTGTTAPALNGQTWCGSLYWRLMNGSAANLTAPVVRVGDTDASGNALTQGDTAVIAPTSAPLSTQRIIGSFTNNSSFSVNERLACFMVCASGVAVDATIRFGAPQLERGGVASPWVPTSVVAVSAGLLAIGQTALAALTDSVTSSDLQSGGASAAISEFATASDIGWTRSTTATFIDANGQMQLAAVNQMRVNCTIGKAPYTNLGVMNEAASANQYPNGNTRGLSGVPWVASGTANANGYTTDLPPLFGPALVIKHSRNTAQPDNNIGSVGVTGLTIGQNAVASFYVWIPTNPNITGLTITLEGGVGGTIAQSQPNLSLRDQWQRCSVSAPLTGTITNIVPRVAGALTGDFLYTTCWQLEYATVASSYIPTTTVPVIRAADQPGSSFPASVLSANASLADSANSDVTNWVRNSTMTGAVVGTPGTPPTGWIVGASSGINKQIVGFGVLAGIPYIDLRIFGTATAAGQLKLNLVLEQSAAATFGQAWTGSVWFQLLADASTVPSSQYTLIFTEVGGPTVYLGGTVVSGAAMTTWQRQVFAAVLGSATVTSLQFGIWSGTSTSVIGDTIDITFRVGAPQLETGIVANPWVATSVVPVSAGLQATGQASAGLADTATSSDMPSGLMLIVAALADTVVTSDLRSGILVAVGGISDTVASTGPFGRVVAWSDSIVSSGVFLGLMAGTSSLADVLTDSDFWYDYVAQPSREPIPRSPQEPARSRSASIGAIPRSVAAPAKPRITP